MRDKYLIALSHDEHQALMALLKKGERYDQASFDLSATLGKQLLANRYRIRNGVWPSQTWTQVDTGRLVNQ